MIVRRCARFLAEEARIHIRHLRQRAGRAVIEEMIDGPADWEVLRSPQAEERRIAEVVAPGQTRRGEAIPDRGQRAQLERVRQAIRLRRVHVQAVRKRRPEHRREVAIERRPSRRRRREERHVALRVVTDRVDVVRAGAQPAVARAVVVLDATSAVRMVGIGMSASLVIGCQRICRMRNTVGVDIGQPSLPAIRARQPPEQVIERAVLHRQHDDVLDT